jgi:hypothetical protein
MDIEQTICYERRHICIDEKYRLVPDDEKDEEYSNDGTSIKRTDQIFEVSIKLA